MNWKRYEARQRLDPDDRQVEAAFDYLGDGPHRRPPQTLPLLLTVIAIAGFDLVALALVLS